MSGYSEDTTDTFWRYSNRRRKQVVEQDDEEQEESRPARPSGFEFNSPSVPRPGPGRYDPSLTVPGSPGPTIRSPSTGWRLQPPPHFELDPRVTTPTRNLFTHPVPPPTFRPLGLNPLMNNEPSSASQHNPFHGSDSDDIDADDGFTDAQRATMMRMRGMNIPMQEATTDAPMQPEDTNAPPVPLGEDGLPRQLTSIDLIARCMDSAKLRAAKERCELVLRRLEAMSDEKQNEFVSIRDSPYSYFSMQLWREALTTCYEKWQEVDHMFKNHVDIYGIVLNQLNKVYNIEADMEMIDMLKQRERQTLRELQIQRLGRERAVTARVLEQLNERLQRTELAVNEVEMVRKEENYF